MIQKEKLSRKKILPFFIFAIAFVLVFFALPQKAGAQGYATWGTGTWRLYSYDNSTLLSNGYRLDAYYSPGTVALPTNIAGLSTFTYLASGTTGSTGIYISSKIGFPGLNQGDTVTLLVVGYNCLASACTDPSTAQTTATEVGIYGAPCVLESDSTPGVCTALALNMIAGLGSVTGTTPKHMQLGTNIAANTIPSFSAGPADDSSGGSPTAYLGTVAFTATAQYQSSPPDSYYLAVCDNNHINTTELPGGPPSCDTGHKWCVSSTALSETSNSCTYQTVAGDAGQSHDWYAFACTAGSSVSSRCSAAATGNSPFVVASANTTPTAVSASASPSSMTIGSASTFTANYTETDSGDTDTIYICKDANCTNCGPTSATSGCYCSSGAISRTQDSMSGTCSYTPAYSSLIGNHSYWLQVCDASEACNTVSAGSFSVVAAPAITPGAGGKSYTPNAPATSTAQPQAGPATGSNTNNSNINNVNSVVGFVTDLLARNHNLPASTIQLIQKLLKALTDLLALSAGSLINAVFGLFKFFKF